MGNTLDIVAGGTLREVMGLGWTDMFTKQIRRIHTYLSEEVLLMWVCNILHPMPTYLVARFRGRVLVSRFDRNGWAT